MNANELADLIGMCGDGGYNQDAATMLRQQQALIEQLEKTQDYLYKTHDADKAEIEALKAALINKSHRNANLQYTSIQDEALESTKEVGRILRKASEK